MGLQTKHVNVTVWTVATQWWWQNDNVSRKEFSFSQNRYKDTKFANIHFRFNSLNIYCTLLGKRNCFCQIRTDYIMIDPKKSYHQDDFFFHYAPSQPTHGPQPNSAIVQFSEFTICTANSYIEASSLHIGSHYFFKMWRWLGIYKETAK